MTYLFLGLSLPLAAWVVFREGLYLPGFFVAVAILPFFGWLTLSLLWSPSRILAYETVKIVLTANYWCLIASACIIAHSRERTLRFLRILIGLSLVVAGMGLYIFAVYGTFKYAGWDAGRVYNNWGRATANGAIILLVPFLRSRFLSGRQLALGALMGVCVFFLLVASSRSALLSLLVPALFFMAVHLLPYGRQGVAMSRAQFLLLFSGLAVVVAVVFALYSGVRIETLVRMQSLMEQAENPDLVLGPNRFAYYAAALTFIAQSPIIGNGVRSYSILFKNQEDPGAHPHNLFLEILSDTGIVGLALFLFFLYVALRPASLRRLRHDPMLLAVAMLFVGRFTAAMVGTDLSNQFPLFAFLGLLALQPAARTGSVPTAAAADEAGLAEPEPAGDRPYRASRTAALP